MTRVESAATFSCALAASVAALCIGYSVGYSEGHRAGGRLATPLPKPPEPKVSGAQVPCYVDGIGLSTAIFRAGDERRTTLEWACSNGGDSRSGRITGKQPSGYVVGFERAFDALPKCFCNAFVETKLTDDDAIKAFRILGVP